jgi:hypothetical protein
MPAEATDRLVAAAQRRHDETLTRARTALRRFEASGEPVTYAKVAAAANVSRAWLYSQPDIRAAVTQLRDTNNRSTGIAIPTRQRTSEASLIRRLEAAHRRNQELTQQITQRREQLAVAHGALRDRRTGQSIEYNPQSSHPLPPLNETATSIRATTQLSHVGRNRDHTRRRP